VVISSGFLEPLESTSIHLIQQGITRLIKLLPAQAITNAEIDEYNRQAQYEFEKIRDFIILHYHLNARQDSDFWRYCQQMNIPDSLRHKIELFRATGKLFCEQDELFSEVAWHQVMLGQNIYPKSYHPLADSISEAQLREFLENLKIIMNRAVKSLPDHEAFLRR
jgi:tryptophan halogenase